MCVSTLQFSQFKPNQQHSKVAKVGSLLYEIILQAVWLIMNLLIMQTTTFTLKSGKEAANVWDWAASSFFLTAGEPQGPFYLLCLFKWLVLFKREYSILVETS